MNTAKTRAEEHPGLRDITLIQLDFDSLGPH
jgi:hypothetical protein